MADGIVVKKFEDSQTDQVVAFMMEDFVRDEPLCKATGVKPSPAIEAFIKHCLSQDVSFVAVDTNAGNKVVGVRLNVLRRDGVPDLPDDIAKEEKFEKINELLEFGFQKCDLFNKYKVNIVLDGRMLSVHKDYRGKQIAARMMEATLNYMKETKLPLCYIPCTSSYTVKVLTKLGFESVYSLPYADYKVNGNVVFTPEEPHNTFTCCAKLV